MTVLAVDATFDWGTFWEYVWPPTALENPLILHGLITTIVMAVAAQTLGVILGLIAALGQTSRWRVVRVAFKTYGLYFRGTPLTIQLALLYYGSAAVGLYSFPDVHIGGIVITGLLQAGVLGLGLNEGAYMAEIFRAGIMSVDNGQIEAAKSMGLTGRQSMRWVILPQAIRVVIPPFGNNFNQMIKSTTLIVILGGAELFNAFQQVNARLFQPFELFFAASFYYLAMTLLWSWCQAGLERKVGRYAMPTTMPDRVPFSRRAFGIGAQR